MSSPVKVLHCLESIGSGGVEQRRLSIAKYLDRRRFSQALVCAKVKGNFDRRFADLGVEVFPIGPLKKIYNLSYYRKLFAIVRNYNPVIIHGAVFEGVISAVVSGLFFRIPIIIIEETSEPSNRTWRGNWLLKILARFANAVIATSPAVYDYLVRDIGIASRKVMLILNGVEPQPEPASEEVRSAKEKLGIREGDFVFGFVGRLLDDHKRVSVLIRSFARLSQAQSNVKLLIIGDGSDRAYLESLASQSGVSDQVIFAGYQARTAVYYRCMDSLALVSQREGFGMVIVEAMFFGLPVIGTAVGGIKDIIVHQETGLLVGVDNESEIEAAMLFLLDDRTRAMTMGEMGRKRAMALYSAERYALEVQNLYTNLLRKN